MIKCVALGRLIISLGIQDLAHLVAAALASASKKPPLFLLVLALSFCCFCTLSA